MEYDAKVIEDFAMRLYKKASAIVLQYCVAGALVGSLAGAAVGRAMDEHAGAGALAGAIVIALLSYSAGQEKAFQLKLQAQVALVQVQIEKNTKTR